MTALAPAAITLRNFDPTRDKSYQQTRLGKDVADFLAWLELGGARPRTLEQYERDLARGALMYPTKGMSDVTDGDAFQIAKQFKPKERRVRVAAWRSFFKWGRQTRRIDVNPFEALPAIKQPPRKVYDLFSDGEIETLCGLPVRDGALMAIMFGAGPRKGDCRNLRLRHWRVDARPDAPYGLLVFLDGKGGKDRTVPATVEIVRALAELEVFDGLKPQDHLWYSRPGGGAHIRRDAPIVDSAFDRWWRRCLAYAGVRYRNPHMARHTFATRYLRGLGNHPGRLETLQLVLGHESIQTTSDLYGHLDMRDVAVDMGLV